jgi:excisionase family DNA binding protein
MSNMATVWMTTRQCAERLGISTDFVVGEIRDKRLQAHVIVRDGKRVIYRVSVVDFEAYLRRHYGRAENVAE